MRGSGLGITALGIYMVGGVGAFTGVAMVLMKEKAFFGWQESGTLGYLFLAVGVFLSLAGVLMMRIYRNCC